MSAATADEIGELLEDRAIDETIVERLVSTGASLDEIAEAMEDVEYEARFGEVREASSARIEEVRTLLATLAHDDLDDDLDEDDEDDEGLTVVEVDELEPEPP